MLPTHKQPGRKPIRRRARTAAKETQIERRMDRMLLRKVQYTVIEIDGPPESRSHLPTHLRDIIWNREHPEPDEHLTLKNFLDKKGMGKEWRAELNEQGLEIGAPILLERLAGFPRPEAVHRGDHARIFKKMRAFLRAIAEAKKMGII